MYTKCSYAKTVFFVPLASFGVLLAGCNVDGLWGNRQPPRGAQKASFHGAGGDHRAQVAAPVVEQGLHPEEVFVIAESHVEALGRHVIGDRLDGGRRCDGVC